MNNGTEQVYLLNSIQNQPLGLSQKQVTTHGTTPVNLENVDNFSNVCRTCATITQLVIPIFTGEGLEHHLAEKIQKHLPIKVSETDLLPLVVCYQCVSTLLAWHELVECCLQADRALNAKIGVNSSTENTKKEAQTIALASSTTTEEDSQSKLNNNYVRPTEPQKIRDPPKYTPPYQLCDFCNTTYPEETFIKHLIVEHSELLFHCEQCDKYLNRRQFITHMSLHAVQYTERSELENNMKRENDVSVINNTIAPIVPNHDANGGAPTRNYQSLNITELVTSTRDSNTTISITNNQNVNITSTVTQNTSVTVPKTDDNSNASATVTRNKTATPVKRTKSHQNTTIIIPAPNPETKGTTPVAGNKHMNATRPTPAEIALPITIHNVTKPIALVRRNQAANNALGIRGQNTNTTAPVTRSQNINIVTEKPDTTTVPQSNKTTKHNQENEFSDHSDIEYGFGPLPESVFEAIEDTQDSQPAEDTSPVPDIEYLDDESNSATRDCSFKLPSSKKPRTCPICSKVYRASSSYFYHLKHTHKKIKEHECEICAKKFATRASLASHITTHTGECQFECKLCKKRFRSNASLYIHEQTHNDIKTFSCKQCDTSFRWRTHLLRHMKRHSAEKAHVCSICGRGFNIHCDLLRHTRTHTAGDFTCEQCDVKFAQMRYLKVHMNKKHSKKAVKK